ncbi:MAG: hypothetical protein WC749_09780 [Dehalococcoidia bacterium]
MENTIAKNTMPKVPGVQIVFGDIIYWLTVVACIIVCVAPLIGFISMDSNVVNPHYLMQDVFNGMKPDFEAQDLKADASPGATVLVVKDAGKFDNPEKVDREPQIRIMDDAGSGELATIIALNKSNDTLTLDKGLINSYKAGHTEVAEVTVWNSHGEQMLAADAKAGQDTLAMASLARVDDPSEGQPVAIMLQDDTNREIASIKSIDRGNKIIHLTAGLTNAYSAGAGANITQVTVVDEVKGGHFWKDNLTKGDGLTQLGVVLGCSVGLPAMLAAAAIYWWKEKVRIHALMAMWVAVLIIVSVLGLLATE